MQYLLQLTLALGKILNFYQTFFFSEYGLMSLASIALIHV